MEDGTIYGGISPINDHAFFTVAPDNLKKMGKIRALEHIKSGKFHGHDDWELSHGVEIAVLYKHRSKGELSELLYRTRKFHWAILENGQVLSVNREGNFAGVTMQSLYFIPIRYELNP